MLRSNPLSRSRYLILFAILSLQLASVWAQQKSQESDAISYAISGTVLDPSGAVIPGARLALMKADGNSIAESISDYRGAFRFDNVNSGKYRVLVQAVGFRDVKTDVTVGARSRAELRITMSLDTRTESVTVAGD